MTIGPSMSEYLFCLTGFDRSLLSDPFKESQSFVINKEASISSTSILKVPASSALSVTRREWPLSNPRTAAPGTVRSIR